MDRNTVDIKVGRVIRQWTLNIYGTDSVLLDRSSNIWFLIKQYLELLPNDYKPLEDRSEHISFYLLVDGKDTLVKHDYLDRCLRLNMLYRCYIPPEGQARIRKYMENQFRAAFLIWMQARQEYPVEKISHSISAFLLSVGVDVESQLLARLQKYWYRWRQKNPSKPKVHIFF